MGWVVEVLLKLCGFLLMFGYVDCIVLALLLGFGCWFACVILVVCAVLFGVLVQEFVF